MNASVKDLDVKGLRSALDEMSMQQLRNTLEDAAALHDVITSLNITQVCYKYSWCFISVVYEILYYNLKIYAISQGKYK